MRPTTAESRPIVALVDALRSARRWAERARASPVSTIGDGCLFFEECNPEGVYQREVGPGELEVFEATSCGTEPVGDRQLCDPGELSSACERLCSL